MAPLPMSAALEFENFTFSYPAEGNAEKPLIGPLSASIEEGAFTLITGATGCGKTTLLRCCKPELAPTGTKSGIISMFGRDAASLSAQESAQTVGFVTQNADNQIVCSQPWHELAFGLENLATPQDAMRLRVAEIAHFFGMNSWLHQDVNDLSGGQKQLLALASVLACTPRLLLLDEPTSQLDPIAANEFIACLVRINRELATTIIMTEHRLEEVLPVCSRAVVMDEGTVLCQGTVKEVAATLKNEGQRLKEKGINRNGLYLSMPAAAQVYLGLDGSDESPVTVAEGRNWLSQFDSKYRESGHEVAPGYVLWMKGMPGRQMVRKLTMVL